MNLNNKTALFTSTDFGDYDVTMKAIQNTYIPDAVAKTLNETAQNVTIEQIRNVRKSFTIRSPYTLPSMTSSRAKPYKSLNKATGREIKRMFSRAGTTSSYLWLQEEDQTIHGITGNVPIPTLATRINKDYKRQISSPNRIKRTLSLRDGRTGTNTFIGRPKGGGRRRGLYRRTNKNTKLVMLRNLESKTVNIKGVGFHKKAINRFGSDARIRQSYKLNIHFLKHRMVR